MSSKPFDEFGLIARYLAPLAHRKAARGLLDDVAVLGPDSCRGDTVLNVDAVVAGVHFHSDERPAMIAERALRVNLSDLAAKGARPVGYLLTLALNENQGEDWLADFASGLADNQQLFGWSLLGGDTVRTSGPLCISVTAVGETPTGRVPSRAGARAGDRIWVTGTIGDGALGLAASLARAPSISAELARAAETRFRLPEPRLAFGQSIVAAGLVTASADVSDGLVADLGHIADASRCRAMIESARVPLSAAGRAAISADAAWLPRLLTGGDDYEIVFSAQPMATSRLTEIAERCGVALTPIGDMVDGTGVTVLGADGVPLELAKSGYRHF